MYIGWCQGAPVIKVTRMGANNKPFKKKGRAGWLGSKTVKYFQRDKQAIKKERNTKRS